MYRYCCLSPPSCVTPAIPSSRHNSNNNCTRTHAHTHTHTYTSTIGRICHCCCPPRKHHFPLFSPVAVCAAPADAVGPASAPSPPQGPPPTPLSPGRESAHQPPLPVAVPQSATGSPAAGPPPAPVVSGCVAAAATAEHCRGPSPPCVGPAAQRREARSGGGAAHPQEGSGEGSSIISERTGVRVLVVAHMHVDTHMGLGACS